MSTIAPRKKSETANKSNEATFSAKSDFIGGNSHKPVYVIQNDKQDLQGTNSYLPVNDADISEKDLTGKPRTHKEEPIITGYKFFKELNQKWGYELRCSLRERPEHYYDVPVDMLEPLPGLKRRRHSEEGINSIAASIKDSGQQERICVTIPTWLDKWPKDKLGVVYGWGRVLAIRKLGLKFAKVTIKALNNLSEAYLLSLNENLVREPISKIEEGEHYKGWIEHGKETVQSIASKIHKHPQYVYKMIYLLSLPAKVQEWIHDGKLPYSFGLSLLRIKNAFQQEELAKMAIEDQLSRTQLEARIKEVQGQEILSQMPLEVEKPKPIQQTQTTQTTPIQRAFQKQPQRKIEEMAEQPSRKLGELDWIRQQLSVVQCIKCDLCTGGPHSQLRKCFEMVKIYSPKDIPEEYRKLVKFLYGYVPSSFKQTAMQMRKELEALGFDPKSIEESDSETR